MSDKYKSSEIEIFSTNLNRTISSGLSQIYGIYPPGEGPRIPFIDQKYHLPPYSNKSNVDEQNYALPNGHQPIEVKINNRVLVTDCPNYQKFVDQNMQRYQGEISEMLMTYRPFFDKMAPMFNFSSSSADLYTMLRVYDAVNVDRYLGRPLPPNFTPEDEENVHHLANWYYLLYHMDEVSLLSTSSKMERLF